VAEGSTESLFGSARRTYHALLRDKVLRLENGVPSNADRGNKASKDIALGIFQRIGLETAGIKLKGQTAGSEFEVATAAFLRETFVKLSHLRPGDWVVRKIGEQEGDQGSRKKEQIKDFKKLVKIAQFEQYTHLIAIAKAASENAELAASLGSDYMIKPDIVIFRRLVNDDEINRNEPLVDDSVALMSSLRGGTAVRPCSTPAFRAN
jgi:hypothetical protein